MDEGSDNSGDVEFTINEDYANKYNTWRQKEEYQKLKDKYGDEDTGDDSSSSESEDEEAEDLDPQKEKDWLTTLAAIKRKDPKIYDKDFNFYQDPSAKKSDDVVKKKIQKPMYISDYDRKVILEKGGMLSDEETGDEEQMDPRMLTHGYFEEQEDIKKSFKTALSDSDEEQHFLMKRSKSKEEQQKEKDDYLEWLKTQKPDEELDKKVGVELNSLKEYWHKPDLDEGEKFLRDYFLNKQFLQEDDQERIPSYAEIVGDEDLSDEEKELEKQEEFEHKYNMRHEEPDLEFIKSYPRTIGDSVRRKDDKRSRKRKEDKDRKQQDKDKKMVELKQLKNLKKQEILGKLDRLREITGNQDVGFSEADMAADFDPEEHDRMMQKVFSANFYDEEPDATKPVFPDDEELGVEENWDEWTGDSKDWYGEAEGNWEQGYDDNDPEYNMDADYGDQPHTSSAENFGLDGKNKKHKKSKFAQAVEKKKPVFDPGDKTYDEYLDEYYKLDYEDVIGDMPCRFKYRKVLPNEFGLSTKEILSCRDKELNTWVSLKKMSQYRTHEEEEADVRIFRRKGHEGKKRNVLPSLFEPPPTENVQHASNSTGEDGTKKKRKKKKKKKNSTVTNDDNTEDISVDEQDQSLHSQQSVNIHNKNTDSQTNSDSKSRGKKRKGSGNDKSVEKKPKLQESGKYVRLYPDKSAEPTTKKNKNPKDPAKKPAGGFHVSVVVPQKIVSTEKVEHNDKKKKRKKKPGKPTVQKLSDERLRAYGLNVKKFKYSQMPKLQAKNNENSR